MAEVLSLLHLISYLPIPVALYVFRRTIKPKKYDFYLPGGKIIAALLFVFFTYLFVTASLKTTTEVILMLAIFQTIFIILNVKSAKDFLSAIIQCYWLLLYFVAILALVWASPDNKHLLNNSLFDVFVIFFGVVFFFFLCQNKKET